jgi:hypothetical protein
MQAKLSALKGQFQLVPNLKRTTGVKGDNKGGDKKQGGGNDKKKKNKKALPTRKSRRRTRIGKDPSLGWGSMQEEGQGTHLVLVQAPHGIGQPQGRRLMNWQRAHQSTKQWAQPSRGPGHLSNHIKLEWQALMASMACNSQQFTFQTRMETMDNVLVSFNGKGKFEQVTSSPNLPYATFLHNKHGLALHQISGGLP